MLKNYSIEVVDEICVVRFFQKPTPSEALSAIDDASDIGKFQRRLWIYQEGADLKTDEIQKIAKHCVEIWPLPSKVAIVASDTLTFGLARMHDVYREQEGVETRVFRTEQEAIGWLENENSMKIP
jgi:hypothetical protein